MNKEGGKAHKGKAACACAHAATERSSAVDNSVLRRISFGANSLARGNETKRCYCGLSLARGGGGKWVAWRRGGNEW